MDKIKNKFRGVFKTVKIDEIKPNLWNPKEKIEENENNKKRYLEIKANIEKKSLYLPIVVREIDNFYEIIDGYHRWRACKELNYTELMIWNLGKISKEEAQSIALSGIYLKVEASEPMTAMIVKEMELAGLNMLELLPFSEDRIEEYLKLAEFNWEEHKEEEVLNKIEQREVECPKCHHKFNV